MSYIYLPTIYIPQIYLQAPHMPRGHAEVVVEKQPIATRKLIPLADAIGPI